VKCDGTEITDEQRRNGVFLSSLDDADANKEIRFINSIESGNYINEAQSGVDSTLSAIMGREAGMSGDMVSWDDLRFSNARLDPDLNLSQFDQ
jgi:myo-inositol 2-dehydrogenase/D-chiro-inositol 1-dehydrogenase